MDQMLKPIHIRSICIGIVLFFFAILMGAPFFSPDSTHLLSIARNIAALDGIVNSNLHIDSPQVPDSFTYWPPLYSILLSIPLILGFSLEVSTLLILLLALALTINFMFSFGQSLDGTAMALSLVGGWLLLGTYGFWVVLTEPLFIGIVSAALYYFSFGDPQKNTFYLFSGLLIGFATLTRSIGVLLVFPFFVSLLFYILSSSEPLKKVQHLIIVPALLTIFGFFVLTLPWLINNYIVGGDALGLQVPGPGRPIRNNLSRLIRTLLVDLWPLVLFMILLGTVLISQMFRFKEKVSFKSLVQSTKTNKTIYIMSLMISWIVIYSAVLFYIAANRDINRIGTRLLSPIYPAFVFLMAVALHTISQLQFSKLLKPYMVIISFVPVFIVLTLVGQTVADRLSSNKQFEFSDNTTWQADLEPITEWTLNNTDDKTLMILDLGWYLQLETERQMLISGYPGMKELNVPNVCDFLQRFGDNFDRVVWIVPADDLPHVQYWELDSYTDQPFGLVELASPHEDHAIFDVYYHADVNCAELVPEFLG